MGKMKELAFFCQKRFYFAGGCNDISAYRTNLGAFTHYLLIFL